jgi:hypothetical protein
MPSLYRTRIDALLAAHTAHLGQHIIITDLDALIHGIADLVDESIREVVADVFRERTD